MKKRAIQWMIAAVAAIFLIGGNAWADGRGDRGSFKGGHGGYHAAPHHPGGHGRTGGYYKPPHFNKHRPHGGPHYRPHHGPGHFGPHRGPAYRHHHPRPHHGRHYARPVRVGVSPHDVIFSALIGHPGFLLNVVAGR